MAILQPAAKTRAAPQARVLTTGRLLMAATLLWCSASLPVAATEYYRWTDENGVTHYTDKPPASADAKRVETRKRQPQLLEEQNRQKEQQLEQERAAQAEAEARAALKNPDHCRTAKQRLTTLQNHQTIQMRTEDGGTRTLSAEEVQAEIEESQKAVERFCD